MDALLRAPDVCRCRQAMVQAGCGGTGDVAHSPTNDAMRETVPGVWRNRRDTLH